MDTATRTRQQYIAETDRLKNEIKMLDLGQGGHRTSATRRNSRTTRLLPFSSRPVIYGIELQELKDKLAKNKELH